MTLGKISRQLSLKDASVSLAYIMLHYVENHIIF